MQSFDAPLAQFSQIEKMLRDSPTIQKKLGPNGMVHVREVFTGTKDRALHDAMDERRSQLEAAGAVNFHRTKIGRNSQCPCGSGLKFKKCCIHKAQFVG